MSRHRRSATRQTLHDRGERLDHRLQNDDVGEAVALPSLLQRLHDLVDAADQDHRFECGQIVESWGSANHLGLLRQLGAIELPAAMVTPAA